MQCEENVPDPRVNFTIITEETDVNVCFHTRSPGAGIIGSQEESQGLCIKLGFRLFIFVKSYLQNNINLTDVFFSLQIFYLS